MLELFTCSLFTIVPDYLYRSLVQGKKWGREIDFFTVWYELRWGITLCIMLTIGLITIVFYYHPQTSNVSSMFRTVTILSEQPGRVAEVYVSINEDVTAGQPVFRLDTASLEASAETARRRIVEVDADLAVAEAERASAEAGIDQARAVLEQTQEDLERETTLFDRGSSAVTERQVDTLRNRADENLAALDAAQAALEVVDLRISVELPAARRSAEAALAEIETLIEKMTVRAGVDGRVEQLSLRVGDIVNPVLRPAGILVPKDAGRNRFQAGFPQVTAPVLKAGGIAEMACASKPFTIIPMVITEVQDVIAAGQIRPSDRLIDGQDRSGIGSIAVFLEPLYPGGAAGIPPGSLCMANAYTSNHEELATREDLGVFHRIYLHVVDTVGVVHAAGLRLRSIMLPFTTLVFSSH